MLRISVPVAAVEFEEDRGVRDGHFRFDEKDAEDLGRLIELCNDLVVRNVLNAGAVEDGIELLAVVFDTRRVDFRDEGEFPVRIDVGADVAACGNCIENVLHDMKLLGAGDDGYDAGL